MSSQVVRIDQYRNLTGAAYPEQAGTANQDWPAVSDLINVTATKMAVVRQVQVVQVSSGRVEPTPEELYGGVADIKVLGRAIELLIEGCQRLELALSAARIGDAIAADDEVQQLGALLPELFCCRQLGDGFGTVINSLQIALSNQHGNPLTERQISAALRAVRRIRNAPYLTFDQAVDAVIEMEDSGLFVDPANLSELVALADA